MNIQNIWAVGRNYSEHAKEMGSATPKEPLIFLKAGSCVVSEGQPIQLPSFSQDVHHEVEIALRLDQKLQPTKMSIAIDITARDIQAELKSKGLPWTLAKSFKDACAIGQWIEAKDLEDLEFNLMVNGQPRQKGHTRDMVFNIETLLTYIKDRFPVVPGDVILTGTPSGVARIMPGDVLEAAITGRLSAKWHILNKT